jgi:ADP-heptose:LPS heptosyltransferase
MSIKIGNRIINKTFSRWKIKKVSHEIADTLNNRNDFIVGDYPLKRLLKDHQQGRVKLRRHGALGDIIVLYPAVREIKKLLPITFTLSCCSKYHSLFRNDDTFDEVIATGEACKLPVIGSVLLDGVLERDLTWNEELRAPDPRWLMPRVFAYYEFLIHGLDLPKMVRPDYSLNVGKQDQSWADRFMQRVGNKRRTIFVQARGSGSVRSIGRERMREITIRLSEKYNVIVTDRDKNYCWSIEERGIFAAVGQRPFLNFVALMKMCDAALTTDSGVQWLTHIAGIPLVSVLGPTRESEKLATHPLYPGKVRGINTAALLGCEPCFENAIKCKWRYDCLNSLNIDVLWREIDTAINEVMTNGNR